MEYVHQAAELLTSDAGKIVCAFLLFAVVHQAKAVARARGYLLRRPAAKQMLAAALAAVPSVAFVAAGSPADKMLLTAVVAFLGAMGFNALRPSKAGEWKS